MIGQKSSPGLGLRRARTWGGKATWRKNWTVTCMPLQHATACVWEEKAAAVCARVGLDGGGGWYWNGERGWGARRRSSCRASGGAGPDAGQTTGHCSAADPAPFIDRWPRSLIVAMPSSTVADQRRSMCRGRSLWSMWRSRVGAEDGGGGLRLGVGSGGGMWDLRCGEKLVREGELRPPEEGSGTRRRPCARGTLARGSARKP
jgi:hypothetical protein